MHPDGVVVSRVLDSQREWLISRWSVQGVGVGFRHTSDQTDDAMCVNVRLLSSGEIQHKQSTSPPASHSRETTTNDDILTVRWPRPGAT